MLLMVESTRLTPMLRIPWGRPEGRRTCKATKRIFDLRVLMERGRRLEARTVTVPMRMSRSQAEA